MWFLVALNYNVFVRVQGLRLRYQSRMCNETSFVPNDRTCLRFVSCPLSHLYSPSHLCPSSSTTHRNFDSDLFVRQRAHSMLHLCV